MFRTHICTLLTAVVSAGLITPVHGQSVSKMALVTIHDSVEISAPVHKVWAALTETDMAHSWYPGWKRKELGQSKSLMTVGEKIPFGDAYGNSGVSVVLFVDPHHELRIAHVPDNGTYLCQAKFVLSTRGDVTVVEVTEQYSDDINVPLDRDTAEMTRKEVSGYLDVLKRLAEGKEVGDTTGAAGGLLDGRVFAGEMGEKNKNAFVSDELSFMNGMFRSLRCDEYNFGEAAYTAAREGDAIVFEVETMSPTDGLMKWKGTVRDTKIDASAEWYDKTGKFVTRYWIRGRSK